MGLSGVIFVSGGADPFHLGAGSPVDRLEQPAREGPNRTESGHSRIRE
jgi:hypothetical protein